MSERITITCDECGKTIPHDEIVLRDGVITRRGRPVYVRDLCVTCAGHVERHDYVGAELSHTTPDGTSL